MSESNAIFKVFFDGALDPSTKGLSLTFFGEEGHYKKIDNFTTFLMKYSDLNRKKLSMAVPNIKEILPFGKANKNNITQFFVFLFTSKNISNAPNTEIRSGILVGNHKELGYVIMGLWPYSQTKIANKNAINYEQTLNDLLQSPEKYKDMILIS